MAMWERIVLRRTTEGPTTTILTDNSLACEAGRWVESLTAIVIGVLKYVGWMKQFRPNLASSDWTVPADEYLGHSRACQKTCTGLLSTGSGRNQPPQRSVSPTDVLRDVSCLTGSSPSLAVDACPSGGANVHPCQIASHDRFSARPGRIEKRVPYWRSYEARHETYEWIGRPFGVTIKI